MTDNTLTNETVNHRNPADDLLTQTPPARPGVTITYDGQTAPDLRLMELVYDELRALAGAYLLYERPDHTLQATALVHEAFLRISEITGIHWRSRAHFFAFAAEAVRRVLVDSARRHKSAKRGGAAARTDLTPTLAAAGDGVAIDVLDPPLRNWPIETLGPPKSWNAVTSAD